MTTRTYSIHRYPSHLIQTLVLANGRRVTVRPVLPQDEVLEQAFVAMLSIRTQRERFQSCVSAAKPPRHIDTICVDYHHHMAFVVTVVEGQGADERELMIADARYVVAPDGETAEFSVAVADAWSGLGLAKRLMALLCQTARRAGLRWICGDVPASNERMLGLLQRCGFFARRHAEDDGMMTMERGIEPQLLAPRPGRPLSTALQALSAWALGGDSAAAVRVI